MGSIDCKSLTLGDIYDDKKYRRSCSYVEQAENLFNFLTVRETMYLAAYFHLPVTTARHVLEETADFAIRELGLFACVDTLVNEISGGEKRRLSIGKEIFSDPEILYLDEPTSGLDSFQAQAIMQCLKQISDRGRIVVAVIHQPRSSIFSMFDKLLLLSEGATMYFGQASGAVEHFTNIGYRCPLHFNPGIPRIFLAFRCSIIPETSSNQFY
jgi:ABC-type multidrug transport system ATPase subunit